MKRIKLILPNIKLESEYLEMLDEWKQTKEEMVPFILKEDPSDFKKFIGIVKGYSKGTGIPKSFVNHSTFWLIDGEKKILGVSNIRHKLNAHLMKEGGHIGYGIRPSERRKGFATLILKFSLLKVKKLGVEKALVTCNSNNAGSYRTIEKNNGKLWKEEVYNGRSTKYFWIDVK